MATKSDPLWIEHAHLKKGGLHKATHTKAGKNIPLSVIRKDTSKGGKIGKQARAAVTLASLRPY